MSAFKKGDHVEYTGEYFPEVKESAKYPPGVIVRFRNYREKATVRLDTEEELYADWPIDEIRKVDE